MRLPRAWALVQSPAPLADVRDAIVGEFDVDEATCERDLLEFVAELERNGMIEVVDERAP